ncbi:hypothetical protein PINS_up020363 [Pythium insidiosum]|nr:hypothetical protein PINS_up020363 [Pythium insidiosum]
MWTLEDTDRLTEVEDNALSTSRPSSGPITLDSASRSFDASEAPISTLVKNMFLGDASDDRGVELVEASSIERNNRLPVKTKAKSNPTEDSMTKPSTANESKQRQFKATKRKPTKSVNGDSKLLKKYIEPTLQIERGYLPLVLEEKLAELEEEVKFYKTETLQLQKKKAQLSEELQKLNKERSEFEAFQQQQRLQIEEEWNRERQKNEARRKDIRKANEVEAECSFIHAEPTR